MQATVFAEAKNEISSSSIRPKLGIFHVNHCYARSLKKKNSMQNTERVRKGRRGKAKKETKGQRERDTDKKRKQKAFHKLKPCGWSARSFHIAA